MANQTPATIRRAVEKLGCSIEIEPLALGGYQIILDAPHGKLFQSSGCHCDCSLHGNGWATNPDWNKTLADAVITIKMGYLDCDDPECKFCND